MSGPAGSGAAVPPVVSAGPGSSAGAPVAAPIPVSAARAEREAIAEATRGLRLRPVDDPVSVAIRIAASLNAEDSPDRSEYEFFWATGVTTDGRIIIANSYGLGYIPAGQNLPEPVEFVSLDAAIPMERRLGWATYPWIALLDWAQAKDVGLRTVIGTEAQLQGIDLGSNGYELQPDDIPSTSIMAGRDRLRMIAPDHAKRLAATSDGTLLTLLPPAPADTTPPPDRTAELWSAVVQPMMSKAEGRHLAQLNALLTYADHCEELAIHTGHTATDPAVQRAAIADGLYWHHLAALHDAAQSSVGTR